MHSSPRTLLAVAYVANPQIKLFLSPLIAVLLLFVYPCIWRRDRVARLSFTWIVRKVQSFRSRNYRVCFGVYGIILRSSITISKIGLLHCRHGMFSVQILLANYILAWLYLKSNRSVFITSLFHGLFNVMATIYFRMAMDVYVTSTLAWLRWSDYWIEIFFKPHSMNPITWRFQITHLLRVKWIN